MLKLAAPASTSSNDSIEKFNEDLKQGKWQFREDSLNIASDFNAKVVAGRKENVKGPHQKRERRETS